MKIDFHSHILPGIDDGAENAGVSAKMLEALASLGVEAVALTPHYYRNEMTVSEFAALRKEAYSEVLKIYNEDAMPRLMLGCECAMWNGMSGEELFPLCLEDTNLLMCEMPYSYSEYIPDELEELVIGGIVPIVAHVDRYFKLYSKEQLGKIFGLKNLIFQVNISSLGSMTVRRRLELFARRGCEFILGSDCHDLAARSPYFNQKLLSKKSIGGHFIPSVRKNQKLLL